jgi:serine/threonine protein kinase
VIDEIENPDLKITDEYVEQLMTRSENILKLEQKLFEYTVKQSESVIAVPGLSPARETVESNRIATRRAGEVSPFTLDGLKAAFNLGDKASFDDSKIFKEYLEGMTCREYQGRFRGRLPFTLALYIMKGTLEILKEVHDRGYIHCDISPINSFLCRDGGVYLIDWGNAADLSGSMEDHVVRQAINVLYAAPEQQISGRQLTPATDLYCLCATLYESVCGSPPAQCLARLRGEPLLPPGVHVSDLPPFLADMLTQGLSLRPDDRPQSAAELLEVIDREVVFGVSPVAGTGNASVSAKLLHEKRRPFGFLTSRRAQRPMVL